MHYKSFILPGMFIHSHVYYLNYFIAEIIYRYHYNSSKKYVHLSNKI